MVPNKQIFQATSHGRWQRVKWTFRILLIISLFFLAVLIVALIEGASPSALNLQSKAKAYADKLNPDHPLTISNKQNKKYKGIKDFLEKKEKEDSLKKLRHTGNISKQPYIRAAFYTPWGGNSLSYKSLEKNAGKLNTVFPEWFFIDTLTHKLQTRIDSAGLALMREYDLAIYPMLTNFNSSKRRFDGELLHFILSDGDKRKVFIQQLQDTLAAYHFQGINIDFEDLAEKTNEPLTMFQENLYTTLHAKGFAVTQDVSPMNDDYDYPKLSRYNDHIILMAYDEFNGSTTAGPISSQKWIEQAVDRTVQHINPEKIILGVGGYGRNWATDNEGMSWVESISYSDAINLAKVSNSKIDYDNTTYNLHFNYIETEKDKETGQIENVKHEVWFTDAATTFNILRFSDEYATAGTVLWRLGSEDERMWEYYDKDLSNDALDLHPFDYSSLSYVPVIPDNVGYRGEGEVLNVIATPQEGKINLEIDSSEQLIAEQDYIQLPSGYIIEKFAEDTVPPGKGHKLVLTFDDGPSAEFTPPILKILEKEKVPATFFIVGLQAEQNIPLLQHIYRDGFEIGNHTFTHNNIAKMSPERAELEMKSTRLLIEAITGHSTILFRAPYNADALPVTYEELEPIARSKKDNYLTIGESIDPMDWQPGVTADSIYARTVRLVEQDSASIILLHDAGGLTREPTVKALPRIIEYFKQRGYVFTTVSDLMGKTKNDVMPPIPSTWQNTMNFYLVEVVYWGGHILFALFFIGIFLSIGRMLLMAMFAYVQKRKESKNIYVLPADLPLVSIIVPAYNEEVNAVRTVQSLLEQDYPNLNIIFVDDGSKDATFEKVSAAFPNNPKVQVHSKPNGGKSSALNYGINLSTAPIVVGIDADTQLKEDAVSELIKRFTDDQVGAVAGNVKVGNEVNMTTRWQSIEYITSQNFDRRAFDLLNCITVVPGAIGAFRREAVIKAGMFTSDTLAEDCDLTMRLHKCGYTIRNCTSAISYTEAPESVRMFLKQRFRWNFGVMQSFWKHRDAVFNPRYKNFGMVAMPNILLFQMILQFLAPLADLILLLSIVASALGIVQSSIDHIVFYYFIFTLVDICGAALAFTFEKENFKKLLWIIPQRFVYRQLMYYVLIKSVRRAIKGEIQGWGKLKRTGNVKTRMAGQ
jgi:peptidoglycan-N-acetylglucosamine deacetylase